MGKVLFWANWVYRLGIGGSWLAMLLGYNFAGRPMNWLVSAEEWLTNRTPDPIMFAFLTGLLLSTWVVPDIWKYAKRHIFPHDHLQPDTGLRDVLDWIVNDSSTALKRPPPAECGGSRPGAGAPDASCWRRASGCCSASLPRACRQRNHRMGKARNGNWRAAVGGYPT